MQRLNASMQHSHKMVANGSIHLQTFKDSDSKVWLAARPDLLLLPFNVICCNAAGNDFKSISATVARGGNHCEIQNGLYLDLPLPVSLDLFGHEMSFASRMLGGDDGIGFRMSMEKDSVLADVSLVSFLLSNPHKRDSLTKEILGSIYPSGGDLARTCTCQWLNESEKVLLEVQASHPCTRITSKLCQWHIMFDLPCPLSLAMAGGKDGQGHRREFWRGLLDEFADEGSVDCTIMGHQLERVGLTPGANGSGLRNLKHVTVTSPSFSAWHLVLQKMITCLASFSKLLCGRTRDVLHQAKCSSGQFAGHQVA